MDVSKSLYTKVSVSLFNRKSHHASAQKLCPYTEKFPSKSCETIRIIKETFKFTRPGVNGQILHHSSNLFTLSSVSPMPARITCDPGRLAWLSQIQIKSKKVLLPGHG